MRKRRMTFSFDVVVPATVGENEVSNAVNAALDEPPCDWGDWFVSLAGITSVAVFHEDETAS